MSGSDCWAVGNTFTALASQTLIEHYDGSAWSIASSANSPNEANYLYGVTCTSSNNCWAVGYDYTQSVQPYPQVLIEHYDGSSWSIASSPNASTYGNYFQAVTCAAADNCWAMGYHGSDAGNILTLTEHYDGTGWSVVNTPNPSNRLTSDLQAISCLDATNCWAIGYSFDLTTSSQFTLIEHYEVPPVPLIAVVSRMTHGSAGTFDVDLPLTGTPGIECRSGGANGEHTLVFIFSDTLNAVGSVTATATSASGTAPVTVLSTSGIGTDTREYVVDLRGVPNASHLYVALDSVTDSAGHSGSVSATMDVLLGDVNASSNVDSADVGQVQRQNNQPLTSTPPANFRMDVNVSGNIDAADVGQVQRQNSKYL